MEIEVFECNSGVAKSSGKPFHVVLAKVDDRVGKLFSDVVVPVGKVSVEMKVAPNREMFFTPRITKVVA